MNPSKPGRRSYSRRAFIKASACAAVTPWFGGCGAPPPGAASSVDSKAWDDLAAQLKGELLRTDSKEFGTFSAINNLRYSQKARPAGIARCQSAEDVRVCLEWAQSHKLPLVARGGGHSYAAYSTTPGLMLDLKRLNSVEFDAATGKAKVGGGAQNLTLRSKMPPTKSAVSHGTCATVGVGGLTLAGGVGYKMRHRGLLIDQLVETEIVTADGKLLRCNDRENTDLFWACRGGGGGNFGINTSFTFQTFPVDKVAVCELVWTSKLDELLPAALELLPAMPDRFGCILYVEAEKGEELTLGLTGQLEGSEDELRKLMAPLLGSFKPKEEKVKVMEYWDAQENFLGENGGPVFSDERSRYAFKPLSANASKTILEQLRHWPGTQKRGIWKMFLMGGAVSKVATDATAYPHRAAKMLTAVELNWDAADQGANLAANQAWVAAFHDSMAEHTSDACYLNFIDDTQKDYLRAYYGNNLERLVQVKRVVDPGNVFNYRQSIPVSL